MTTRHHLPLVFVVIIVGILWLQEEFQVQSFTNVYSAKTTLKSFTFSPDGLSLYFASQDNAIRKMEEKHHHHIQAVACDPNAMSGYSGDYGSAMIAGCDLSNKQGTLQVTSYGNIYFVNGLSLRMVEKSGTIKTILEDDIISMYVNEFGEIIYISGNMIKKRISNGIVQVIAGGFECIGDQDGLYAHESCVHPSHVVQDESMDGEIYFYDEKLRVIRKIQHDSIITTVSGTSDYHIFDVRHGIIYCSNGRQIKRIEKDGTFKLLGGGKVNNDESPDGTEHELANLHISILKISPEWGEDEVYFISKSGDLRKINRLGKLLTMISKSNFKPRFYRTRTILSENEIKTNNNTCYYCFDNSTMNGNDSMGNHTFPNNNNTLPNNNNNTLPNNNNTYNGNGSIVNNSTYFGNDTSGNSTFDGNNGTQPFDKKIDYYPTPIISSQVSQDGSGIKFLITFGKSNLYTHRLFYEQDSVYDTTLCKNTYLDKVIPIFLVDSSDVMLTENYTTNYIPLDNLIRNPSVEKKFTANSLQLTINLALEYIDDYGEFNGGFCRAIIYKTQQVINIFYSSTISSYFSANHLLDYSYKIYPQLITTDSYSGAGSLIVEMMLETSNLTLQQFSFHNSTNPNCNFIINSVVWQFRRDGFEYTKISMRTASKAFDFTGTSLFTSIFESSRGFIFTDFIPLVINYQIVIPPENQNTTVKFSMQLSGNDFLPKSSFTIGDSLYVKLNAYFSYGSLKLRTKSAYFCCMKEFSPAPIYDPSNNLYGCAAYDSATMDVWKNLYSGFIPNSQMEIYEFPTSEITHIFSFKLKHDYFPHRTSTKSYNAACYIQTTGGLQQPSRGLAHSHSYPETVVQPLGVNVVVMAESSGQIVEPPVQPITSQKVISGSMRNIPLSHNLSILSSLLFLFISLIL